MFVCAGGWAHDLFAPSLSFGPFIHRATLTPTGLNAVAGDIALIAADGVVNVLERDPATEAWTAIPLFSFSRVMAVGEILHHAAIHSIHHRGQVTLLLRALGHTPGNVDMLFYSR